MYILRRSREDFRKHMTEKDENNILTLIKKANQDLEVIRR